MKRLHEFDSLDWVATAVLVAGLVWGFAGMETRGQTIRCSRSDSTTAIPASTTTVTANLCSGSAVGDFSVVQSGQGGTFGNAFSGPGFANQWAVIYQDIGTPNTAGAAYSQTLLLNDITTGTVSVNSTSGGPGGFALTDFIGSGVTVQNTYHAQGSGITSPINFPAITVTAPATVLYFCGTSQSGSATLSISRGTQQGTGTFNTSFNTVSYQEHFTSNATVTPSCTWTGTGAVGYVLDAIVVNPPTGPPPLALTPGTCTGSGAQGTQYIPFGGCGLLPTGGTPPYTFSFDTSRFTYTPPEGLAFNTSTGALSGTPYGPGDFPVTFTVTDAASNTSTLVVTISIAGNYTKSGWDFFPADSFPHLRVDAATSGLPVDTSIAAPLLSGNLGVGIQFETDVSNGGIPWVRWPATQASITVNTIYPGYDVGANFAPFSLPSPDFAMGSPGPPIVPSHNPVQSDQISLNTPIEATSNNSDPNNPVGGSSDGHSVTVILPGMSSHPRLLEQYHTGFSAGQGYNQSDGNWDLTGYQMPLQDVGEATDAAGLPVGPLLINYDEALAGTINHAARFTLNSTLNYHVWPATAQAGSGACIGGYEDSNNLLLQPGDPGGPGIGGGFGPPTSNCSGGPLGEIYRLKASFNSSSTCPGNTIANNVITAFRNYGIILADNGRTGSVTAAADSRWPDMSCLTGITLGDFEPVNVQSVIKTRAATTNLPTVSYQTTVGTPTAATPTFSPVAGTYAGTQSVTISTTAGTVICYNTTGSPATNGTTGCATGTLYTSPVSVATSETLFAVAGGTGFVDSSVGSAAYVIHGAAATPTFNPVAGPYAGTQSVTLSTATSGCGSSLVWNTTNAQSGGNLTGTSSTNPLSVASSETVYAQVQSCPTYINSSVGSAAYTINPATPIVTIHGPITITGPTGGAVTIP